MIAAIICAAGSSSRMAGEKKEFLKMNGSKEALTVLGAVAAAFCKVSSIKVVVIVIQKNTEEAARAALPPECLSLSKPDFFFVEGGLTRQASVFNALSFLAKFDPDYVLIHDGARPWIEPSLIKDIIEAAEKYGAVIPAAALCDTPKECTAPIGEAAPVFIKKHLKRANTVAAQTPQCFKFTEILLAHEKAAKQPCEFTDDAEVWGMFCGDVAVIPGSPENRKITFPGDMVN